MKPIDFPRANLTLSKPDSMSDEECGSLRVCREGPQMVSCWQPSEEERAAIAAGAPVWLFILGAAHPPVLLQVMNPFLGDQS